MNGNWLIYTVISYLLSYIPHPQLSHINKKPQEQKGVTSYHREVSADRALAAGFDCFLYKLDSPNMLIEAISKLVMRSRGD